MEKCAIGAGALATSDVVNVTVINICSTSFPTLFHIPFLRHVHVRVAPSRTPRGSGSPRPYPPLVRPSQKHSNHERMHGIIGTSARTTPSRESATQPWRSPFTIPFLIYPTSTPLGSRGGSIAAKFPPTITLICRDHITSYLSQAMT